MSSIPASTPGTDAPSSTTTPDPRTLPGPRPATGDRFADRHIATTPKQAELMAKTAGFDSLAALMDAAVPKDIRLKDELQVPSAMTEPEAIAALQELADQNTVLTSMIGMGYHGCHTPMVVRRAILENPRWYTPYTPYQAELSQGRLEALMVFQQVVQDLTGLPIAGASLLDEATAAAEAMAMCIGQHRGKRMRFLASDRLHPQTEAVLKTRCHSMGVELVLAEPGGEGWTVDSHTAGVLIQDPDTRGRLVEWESLAAEAKTAGALVVVATDPLALCLLESPGKRGADVAVGCMQRFGMPMGGGGPHAGFLACTEALVRKMPGRLIGVSQDRLGKPAYRMALQTREQHIRRDKATSNICTAQALPAIVSAFYALHHGPEGLRQIARRVQGLTLALHDGLLKLGYTLPEPTFFDTLTVTVPSAANALAGAREAGYNLRPLDATTVGITLDETTTDDDVIAMLHALAESGGREHDLLLIDEPELNEPAAIETRTSPYLTHELFAMGGSEHDLLRYAEGLIRKDYGLSDGMIPLGSCTMKLNAAAEMHPILWPAFAGMHPFVPAEQQAGTLAMARELERDLAEITGFAAVSLQPNAGSQGEYAGLLTIKHFHEAHGDTARDACLIPVSAHGTNPASAVIAGMRVVPVACDERGDVDLVDLQAKLDANPDRVAALMLTYPSTHGVFETGVRAVCDAVHQAGGLVYMDGANMNAQVGLTSPGACGADVCHLNLHKTFCIPHGGGGPGMGPIACVQKLAPFLPGHVESTDGMDVTLGRGGAISGAPIGSAMILPISWMYIRMMGPDGLRRASEHAIAAANYLAAKLREHVPVLYAGPGGAVAHEFILDWRGFDKTAGVTIDDIAKRLMDYGFHAPTMSWPVPGTLMVEPTESEPMRELDRFVEAMIGIRQEIADIEANRLPREDHPLKHAPHPAVAVTADHWPHAYSRERAAYPVPGLRLRKFWPSVARIDNANGDRNLVCACPPMEAFA